MKDIGSFFSKATLQPASKLFLDGEETLGYGELIEKIKKISTLLQQHPIRAGDLVMIAVENPARFAEILLALLANGLGAVITNPGMAPREFRGMLENTDPAGIIIDQSLASRFGLSGTEDEKRVLFTVDKPVPDGLLGKLLGKRAGDEKEAAGYPGILDGVERTVPQEWGDLSLAAWVVNTSGSTSSPKNVLVSRRAMLNTTAARSSKYGITEDARIHNVLPLYHGDGFIQGPLLAFCNGATWVRPCEFQQRNLPLILDSVYGRRVTHFIAVPVLLNMMLRLGNDYRDCFDTADFRMLVSVAANLPEALWREFEQSVGVEIVNMYSLTECSTALYNGPDPESRCVGSLGKPHGAEIRIMAGDGTDVGAGETGELLLRGKSLMDGYINNPDATAATMYEDWLRTGDLVRQDEAGFITLVGRVKEMISFAGHTIMPAEIVEVLELHPEVAEAFVVGIESGEWGENPVAFVMREAGCDVSAGILSEYCRGQLSEYKVPREIVFVDEFIRTATGKINTQAMIEGYRARGCEVSGDTVQQILSIAQSCFRSSELPGLDATPVTEPGWDSLAHMELLLKIEEVFEIRFSTREIMMLEGLGEIIQLVRSKRTD